DDHPAAGLDLADGLEGLDDHVLEEQPLAALGAAAGLGLGADVEGVVAVVARDPPHRPMGAGGGGGCGRGGAGPVRAVRPAGGRGGTWGWAFGFGHFRGASGKADVRAEVSRGRGAGMENQEVDGLLGPFTTPR